MLTEQVLFLPGCLSSSLPVFLTVSFLCSSDWPESLPLHPKFKAYRWEWPGWLPLTFLMVLIETNILEFEEINYASGDR